MSLRRHYSPPLLFAAAWLIFSPAEIIFARLRFAAIAIDMPSLFDVFSVFFAAAFFFAFAFSPCSRLFADY